MVRFHTYKNELHGDPQGDRRLPRKLHRRVNLRARGAHKRPTQPLHRTARKLTPPQKPSRCGQRGSSGAKCIIHNKNGDSTPKVWCIDFATGMITAALGRSKKSKSGGMSSKVGWTGLAKKFSVLMLIVVAVRIDVLLSTNYVRDTVCIAFCCNELISILENAGLMGIELPTGLKNAIDLLQHKAGVDEKTDENKEDDDNNGNSET